MGLLRFLLALSVLVTHSEPLFGIRFLPGNIAVESFFIISGFYMSMIITEKYSKAKNGYKLFITNRLLRIYPIYWFVLLVSVGYCIALIYFTKRNDTLSLYTQYGNDLTPTTLIYFVMTNMVILGQDTLLFLKTEASGKLQFTSHFLNANPRLYTFMFIPQAWSLSLELMFYFMAPLFIKLKNNALIIITVLILVTSWG